MTIETTKIIKKDRITKTVASRDVKTTSRDADVPLTTLVLESFDEAMAVSEQLSGTVKELESATQSQTRGIEEVSQSIQSISDAIQNVAANATKAMDMMHKSEKITQNINNDAEKGIVKMDGMKSVVSESSTNVKALAKELTKVDSMAGFITQIAEQTNLLALNAAIEAARAGDVGRGFAVVADEVRRLAENSKKGAEDISELISTLKESSNKTTDSIEKGNELVEESYEMITNILKSIKDVSSSLNVVVAQMEEIAAATEEVSSGTEEATAASEEILTTSQENLTGFGEIVEAKNQEVEVLRNAQTVTKQLAELTDAFEDSIIVSTTDTDGNILYMNKYFIDVSRHPSEALMGQSHRILKSGWHDPALFDALWKTITSGKTFKGYVRNRAKDGSIYWVKTAISPQFDESGNIKSYTGVRTPITELMEFSGIEQACKEDEAGKPLSNPKMAPVIKKLKFGDYTCVDNI